MMHMLKQNKRVHGHQTGSDIPTQGDKPNKGFVGILSLPGKEVFQGFPEGQMVKHPLAMQET